MSIASSRRSCLLQKRKESLNPIACSSVVCLQKVENCHNVSILSQREPQAEHCETYMYSGRYSGRPVVMESVTLCALIVLRDTSLHLGAL